MGISDFPNLPGVYIFKDAKGIPIYVGKAKSLKNRVSSYFKTPLDSPKTELLVKNQKSLEYIVTQNELEALLLENKLIKKFKPKYNILLKDDKNYPYIKLTINEDYPRLLSVRKKESDGALYFGPYDGRSVKETIKLVNRLFSLRTCKDGALRKRSQPCLKYHIRRCFAPCVGAISKKEYRVLSDAAASLLSGDLEGTLFSLKKEMEGLSKDKKFEQAAKIRDQIRGLEKIEGKKPSWVPKRRAISFKNVLEDLKKALGLYSTPNRIEAFDISNISGTNSVASMVVFSFGEPLKSDYRKFIIRKVEGINDPESIREAVYRRYSKTLRNKLPKPDLILVDGGITQVNSAYKAITEAGVLVPLIGLAKKEEAIFFPKKKKPLVLDRNSEALMLLQKIRDEAHRFAVSFHKKRRSKAFLGSL